MPDNEVGYFKTLNPTTEIQIDESLPPVRKLNAPPENMVPAKEDDPFEPCAEYVEDEKARHLSRTLMGDTAAMREAGELYLPMEVAEEQDAYDARLKRSVLFNAYRRAVRVLGGKLFAAKPKFSDDMDPRIRRYMENVDLQGNNAEVFIREYFEQAVVDGIVFLYANSPEIETTNGLVRLDQADQIRPYLRKIEAADVIGWRMRVVAGRTILDQLRVTSWEAVNVGRFGSGMRKIVTVFEPGVYTRYAKREDGSVETIGAGVYGLDFIPITVVNVNKYACNPMRARPFLENLSFLNCAHWQSSSDQRNINHVIRSPILFGTGFGEELDAIEVSVNSACLLKKDGATLNWVEHTGAAVSAGKDELEELRQQMSDAAMEVLIARPGDVTATEVSVTEAHAQSELEAAANRAQDGFNGALIHMAAWMIGSKPTPGAVTLGGDYKANADGSDLAEIMQLRTNNDLSRDATLKEYIRRGKLAEDFDPKKDAILLAAEGAEDALRSAALGNENAVDGKAEVAAAAQ